MGYTYLQAGADISCLHPYIERKLEDISTTGYIPLIVAG